MVKVSSESLVSGDVYVPGLPKEYVHQKYGVPLDEIAKLASAENPHGASPKALAAVEEARNRLDTYPDWTAGKLRAAIGNRYGFDPVKVVCGSGETEVISMVIRAFAGPDEPILMHNPCFPIYRIYTATEGRRAVFAPMGEDFDPMMDDYIRLLKTGPRIAFLTNPHNPSGRGIPEADLRRVCEEAPKDTLVVFDEAYIHYSASEGGMHLLREFDNLIVLRTMSKAFGLAGLRVGFAISDNAELIRPLMNIKPTWNLGHMQIAGGVAGIFDTEHVERAVTTVLESKAFLTAEMAKLNRFRMVPDSQANFFLTEILDRGLNSTTVFNGLLARGVIVKDGTDIPGLGDRYLRVDFNLRKHMERFLWAIREIEADNPA